MSVRYPLAIVWCIALTACTKPGQNFLINGETLSPLLEVATTRSGAACASRELRFSVGKDDAVRVEICDDRRCVAAELSELEFSDRSARVNLNDIRLGSGNASEGPVIPVEGPDGLLWLCKEDEEAQECICIPWFQD